MVRIARSENGVRRVQKVSDRAAFAHELRVVAKGESLTALLAAFFFQDGKHNRFGGSSQDRTPQNKNMRRLFLPDGGADFPRNMFDVAEVKLAIFQAGGSDANE